MSSCSCRVTPFPVWFLSPRFVQVKQRAHDGPGQGVIGLLWGMVGCKGWVACLPDNQHQASFLVYFPKASWETWFIRPFPLCTPGVRPGGLPMMKILISNSLIAARKCSHPLAHYIFWCDDVNHMLWPSQWADLNTSEHLWEILEQHIRQLFSTIIKTKWGNIFLQRLEGTHRAPPQCNIFFKKSWYTHPPNTHGYDS